MNLVPGLLCRCCYGCLEGHQTDLLMRDYVTLQSNLLHTTYKFEAWADVGRSGTKSGLTVILGRQNLPGGIQVLHR